MSLRSSFLAVALLAASLTGATAQSATDYPTRRIHLILPYPAGGIVDSVVRIVTEPLSAAWKQPIIIEARPTASGNLAWDQVSRVEPDGYTWTFYSPATVINPRIFPDIKWSERSFVPTAALVWAPSVLVVSAETPVNSLSELIEYAKKNPDVLNWANPGIGTTMHVNTVKLLNSAKMQMTEVRYRGQPPAIIDLLTNRVQAKIASVGLVIEHIKSGKLKPLAVISHGRTPLLPDVPTMSELGFPEVNLVTWYGLAVPKGTPQPIVAKITNSISDTLKLPKVRTALENLGLQVVEPMSPEKFSELVESDIANYAKLITEANIKIDQ